MSSFRSHGIGAVIGVMALTMLLLAGCGQRVFVGFPTPTPAPVVLTPNEDTPLPPFGPSTSAPELPVPGNVPAAVATVVTRQTSGPAFVWSETENYLLLGTDHRKGSDNWRTDTIMVVGIDRKLNRAAVLSVPRDLYLEIPNYGYGRINQVDYIGERILRTEGGGPALVSTVLSQTLGIETQHWLRFQMTAFQDVVDAVGGVTIHLDCPFYEPIFNLTTESWEYFTLPAGEVHMDGETAYWYVRLRLRESDIGRSQRQRQFLWALRDQMLTTNLLPQMPMLWATFRSSFSTDLTLVELLDLVRLGLSMDSGNVRASGITLRELQSYTTERGASVLIISDPNAVESVVNGIWDAPAMVDARRQDAGSCAPLPVGAPSVAADALAPTPTPEVPLEGKPVEGGEAAAPTLVGADGS